MKKQRWIVMILVIMMSMTLLGPGMMTTYASDLAWVHVDTVYKFYPDREDYNHPGHYAEFDWARGAFIRLEQNEIEANFAVDVYEEALYGRGPYSHTEDRHARFTWQDPPSVVSGDSFQLQVDVDVLSGRHSEAHPASRYPYFEVHTASTGWVTTSRRITMIDPVRMERESDNVGGKSAPRVSINPYGEAMEDSYTEGRYAYLDTGGSATFGVGLPELRSNREGDQIYVVLQVSGVGRGTDRAAVAYLYEMQSVSPGDVPGVSDDDLLITMPPEHYEDEEVRPPASESRETEATAAGNRMEWPTVSGVLGYRIFRSTNQRELGISVTDFYITAMPFVDVNIEPDTDYYYTVKPVLREADPLRGVDEELGEAITTYTVRSSSSVIASGEQKSFIVLQIDKPNMVVNGVSEEIDPGRGTTPQIISNRTIVPIRAIVEAMGGTVGWDGSESKITLNAKGNNVEMWLNSTNLRANGAPSSMDVAPVAIGGRTFVPVRFSADNLDAEAHWLNSTREVVITF
ncbi:MAG: copper amine oxidase N-terminal domain-containing protein [Tindallia sp. MSAO_Bac2]|nr:MAG: copper amine oxidase N-terminal domain-containing protein [Tindallia sp. MSAO_Bac2]